MENAAYVSPPPLPPQAHLAFANTVTSSAGGTATPSFQEALMSRMGRPFGLTNTDMKDLPGGPFLGLAAAARGVAPAGSGMDSFPGGLPGALALSHHMSQPGFGLHHFIDPRLPFSAAAAGAFRPFLGNAAAAAAAIAASVNSSSASSSSPPQLSDSISKVSSSAFQPPIKGQTSPSSTLFSPGQNLYPRVGPAGSPGTPSSSPPLAGGALQSPASSVAALHHHHRNNSGNGGHPGGKLPDENSNIQPPRHDSISPASMDSSIQDDERVAKKIRLSSSSSANNEVGCCCPICGMPLRTSELEMHYTQELEYLTKLSASLIVSNQQRRSPFSLSGSPNLKNQLSGSLEVAPRSRWDTFQRIQRNRQSRIRVKLSRRAGKRSDEILEEDIVEPVSNSHDHHHHHHHNHHQQNHHAFRKMEQPQSSSTPAPTSSTNPEDEDIDIVGEGDNSAIGNKTSSSESSRDLQLHVYGPPQFTEADVLACMNTLEHETEGQRQQDEEMADNSDSGKKSPSSSETLTSSSTSASAIKREMDSENENENEVMNNTETKNMEDNKENIADKSKCAKCLKSLKDPVVNVGCWHVQCEKCWLISLGTKKSCSLCGIQSLPSDLRRVFL